MTVAVKKKKTYLLKSTELVVPVIYTATFCQNFIWSLESLITASSMRFGENVHELNTEFTAKHLFALLHYSEC